MKHLPSLWAIWAQPMGHGMPREECSADVDGAIDLAVENEAWQPFVKSSHEEYPVKLHLMGTPDGMISPIIGFINLYH